jgi:hypothetical protein
VKRIKEPVMSVEQLIEAIKEGNFEKTIEIINTGVDVNQSAGDQGWTPLNYAAGKGDLETVKALIEKGQADVFKTGLDSRTPYKIALAACHVEVAKYLCDAEEKVGGDKNLISSRQGENRIYCRAHLLKELRRYSGWSESRINWKDADSYKCDSDADAGEVEFSDDDIVYIHQDYTVTQSMWHDENVLFNEITSDWKEFCKKKLNFKVPSDFDLIRK